MQIENVAKSEKGCIEKVLAIRNKKDGDILITARVLTKKGAEEIEMTFTKNSFEALLGGWLIFSENKNLFM